MKTLSLILSLAALGASACHVTTGPGAPAPEVGAVTSQAHASGGPSDTYRRYQETLVRAATMDEITPYLSTANRDRVAAQPAAEQTSLLQSMQRTAVPGALINNEKQDGDHATLDVTGSDRRAKVQMVREGGAWRVHHEAWEAKQPAPAPAPLPSRP